MRYLLILIICSSYLLVSCAVSKCYESSNLELSSPNLTIQECKKPHNAFCAVGTFKNGKDPWSTCGDDEFCISKGCSDTRYCPKSGTFEHDLPGSSNVKFTITCCETDLCNVESNVETDVESSAKTLCRISFSSLFYMSIFCFFYFVTL